MKIYHNDLLFVLTLTAACGLLSADSARAQTFSNVYVFPITSGALTNSAGAAPQSALIKSGNTLFGTTGYGGTSGNGVVFRVDANGTNFTNLHSFSTLLGP